MVDLLTTRQVQEILKVDRITVYRMLQDGRIKGVKIGQQWRFPQAEMDRLVNIGRPASVNQPLPLADDADFPTHCVQTIQDMFSEISLISAVVLDMNGTPLTKVSRQIRFCELLAATDSGRSACLASWRDFSRLSQTVNGAAGSRFFTCQAGFQYVGAPIFSREEQVGLFLAGQFYWQTPDAREEGERIRRLSSAHGIAFEDLRDAANEIPVVDPALHARVEKWPFAAAQAVQTILQERLCYIERLKQIADLTHFS